MLIIADGSNGEFAVGKIDEAHVWKRVSGIGHITQENIVQLEVRTQSVDEAQSLLRFLKEYYGRDSAADANKSSG